MADGFDSDDQRRRTHRALANVNRLRLVKLLEDGPKDVAALTETTGLHPNTVRAHLDVLTDGGVIDRTLRPSTGPGRPAWVYGLPPPPPAAAPPDQRLAEALVDALRQVADDPSDAAETAGRTWGQQAVAGEASASPEQAIARIAQLLEEQGFAPEVHHDPTTGQTNVSLHACPYEELARQHGEIICSIHRGLLRGALEELESTVEVDLHPFVEPGLCVVRLP